MINLFKYSFSLKCYSNLNNSEWILGMEHKNLTLEDDKNLIDNILNNIDMRYIVLFLYIIRNDLFKDLSDNNLIESFEKVLVLDDIYKSNVFELPVSRKEIGEFIEMTTENVIRTLSEFRKDNIIKINGKIIEITDYKRLKQICEFG